MELTIDKEFESLLPALKPEELNYLDESLDRDGCLSPIVVWANHDDTILDGHNRYRICKANGYKFTTKAITLQDRLACKIWIRKNGLARRNYTDEQRAYEHGELYEDQKKADGGTGANQHTEQVGKNCPPARTSAKLAKELGVSEKTIRNDAKFAKAVDAVARVIPEAKTEILSGRAKSGLSKKDVVEIAALEPEEIPAAIEKRKAEPKNGKVKVQTGVDVFLESVAKLIDRVNALVARNSMKHTQQSRALVAHLEQIPKLARAMERSWRNE